MAIPSSLTSLKSKIIGIAISLMLVFDAKSAAAINNETVEIRRG